MEMSGRMVRSRAITADAWSSPDGSKAVKRIAGVRDGCGVTGDKASSQSIRRPRVKSHGEGADQNPESESHPEGRDPSALAIARRDSRDGR
jgi:hypothetical protein